MQKTEFHLFFSSFAKFRATSRLRELLSVFICVHLWLNSLSQAQGLDSLTDEKLMNELANRGMATLLDRAFEVNNVPEAQRESRRTMLALRQLSDGSLSRKQQQELIAKIIKGIDAALPNLKDPEAMMQQARVLIDAGATRYVDALELWGDNFATRQALKPVAETIVRLYDRAAAAAGEQVEIIGNAATVDDRRLSRMYDLGQLAIFNARMSDYLLAIALDPSDSRRAEVAQRGIEYLAQLDAADQPIRIAVRLRLGKLYLLKGDFDKAREIFDSTANDDTIKPTPTKLDAYQARYFRVATDLAARDPVAAQKQLSELTNWQVLQLSGDDATLKSANAAAAMLQYRVHELSATMAKNPTEKQKASEAAVATLSQLLTERPDLAGTINELLVTRLPENAPLNNLDPLLLSALVRQGEEQRLRPANEQADEKILRRAIAAANELISRSAGKGIDAALLDNCKFVLPFLHQRLGDNIAAAEAFLNYAETAGKTERGGIALDNAQAIVATLRKDRAEEEPVRKLYERFLATAIDRFDRKEFAFEQARRLQLLNKPVDAAKYYRLVPETDSRATTATFLLMLATKQQLDELPVNDTKRIALLEEVQRLADIVNKNAAKPQAADASMLVRTKLLAAELARTEQRNPQRAIDMLSDIEPSLAKLPNGDALMPEVLLVRVQSYMALGQSTAATEALVQLLSKREGGQGAAIVYSLLEKLNQELDSARTAGDVAKMRAISRNRAELSGFLAKWAGESTDPKINKFAYRYMVFDAASKHLAADLETDPAAQRTAWEAALALYRSLEAPDKFALYRGTLEPTELTSADYDPAVSLGIASLAFDLGQFEEARNRFSRLLNDRKLGTPVVAVEENGVRREVDNDQYWEAVLKFIRANVAMNENVDQSKAYLKEQYIRWGDRVGGKRWRSDFEKLRGELMSSPAATQPN